MLYGLICAPAIGAPAAAESPAAPAAASTPAEIARLKYEQSRPQKEIPFNPAISTSLAFGRVAPNGADIYIATFAHGKLLWLIGPVSPQGKVTTLLFRPYPP